MVTRQEVEQEVQRLRHIVAEVVAEPEATDLGALAAMLHQTVTSVQSLRTPSVPDGDTDAISPEPTDDTTLISPALMQAYFPPEPGPATSTDLAQAAEQWEEAFKRGRLYRDEALARVGDLWNSAETAQKLGVKPDTVNLWRGQGKLLGFRFNNRFGPHPYLYPAFQFTESRAQDGRVEVLPHFSDILGALGKPVTWEKAVFFLTKSPRLGGKTPLDILYQHDPSVQLDVLRLLARNYGEMGSNVDEMDS